MFVAYSPNLHLNTSCNLCQEESLTELPEPSRYSEYADYTTLLLAATSLFGGLICYALRRVGHFCRPLTVFIPVRADYRIAPEGVLSLSRSGCLSACPLLAFQRSSQSERIFY